MTELNHSGHDFSLLLWRWESFVEKVGWKIDVIAKASDRKVIAIQNEKAANGDLGGLYISAGVHGDECAPVWALLQWCEAKEYPKDRPITLFPCLNPHGLVENTRGDHLGIDLNRSFQHQSHPVVAAWMRFLQGRKFDTAVNLHEDYDSTGIYLYELARRGSPGDELLKACEDIIPREASGMVDGNPFENGLLRREAAEEELRQIVEAELEGGWPEAIWLYLFHAENSFTFETPSEMALERRIKAHRRFLNAL
ncbi:MAG: hypothetical protein CMO55_28310 [Verrucomicrobiales bacterium]|nr:hypothetical protein [Verrucomicrobiales bacterium]